MGKYVKRKMRTMGAGQSTATMGSTLNWGHRCGKCRRQCDSRALSRDGLSECPAGGRHVLS